MLAKLAKPQQSLASSKVLPWCHERCDFKMPSVHGPRPLNCYIGPKTDLGRPHCRRNEIVSLTKGRDAAELTVCYIYIASLLVLAAGAYCMVNCVAWGMQLTGICYDRQGLSHAPHPTAHVRPPRQMSPIRWNLLPDSMRSGSVPTFSGWLMC